MTELETQIADNRAAVEQFIATARGLNSATWAAPRAEGAWSPAQITEHLAIIYEYNRTVVKGTAASGAPGFLRPLLRWFIVDRTLKAGRFVRKGRAPAIFRPKALQAPAAADVLTRLMTAVTGLEGDIRSGHPAGRHTVAHPFFGTLQTTDWMRLQAIHTRHHHDQIKAFISS
jgi:Protein of unknown function (DUF1569)